VTPRPNFLVLLGDRYGWRPLPDAVPAAELEALLQHLPVATRDQLLWRDDQPDDCKGWYRLDENAVVPLRNHRSSGSGPGGSAMEAIGSDRNLLVALSCTHAPGGIVSGSISGNMRVGNLVYPIGDKLSVGTNPTSARLPWPVTDSD